MQKLVPPFGQPWPPKHRPRILKGIALLWLFLGAFLGFLPAIERSWGLPSWWNPLTDQDKKDLPMLGLFIGSCWAGLTYILALVIDTRESVGLEPVGMRDEIDAATLGSWIGRMGFVTVHDLRIEEVPQPPHMPFAILNVTGSCSFHSTKKAGLCVMLVGSDATKTILWSCCLMAQPKGQDTQPMLESLLVAPAILGKTKWIRIQAYGGPFLEGGAAQKQAMRKNETS